jgi:hypothetical protein
MGPGRARGLKVERRASAALGVSAADSIDSDGQHAVASALKVSRCCYARNGAQRPAIERLRRLPRMLRRAPPMPRLVRPLIARDELFRCAEVRRPVRRFELVLMLRVAPRRVRLADFLRLVAVAIVPTLSALVSVSSLSKLTGASHRHRVTQAAAAAKAGRSAAGFVDGWISGSR